jgi:hypothetical protein
MELTTKGVDMLKIRMESKSIDGILSFLNEEERQQLQSVLVRILTELNEYTVE